jgi:hypothetical protein
MTGGAILRFSGSVPKDGHRVDECEDRFACTPTRFAVADGASEGAFSAVWASMLADSFCRADLESAESEAVEAWLDGCRAEWQRWAEEMSQRELPWFTREALRTGAHATFVGLAFVQGGAGDGWRAVACGDACAFVVRRDRLALAFPVGAARQFGASPRLLRTGRGARQDFIRIAIGVPRPGDAFYLVTDALARWFLADHERGEKPWTVLDALGTADEFARFVADTRQSGALPNDDVTLMSVVVPTGA